MVQPLERIETLNHAKDGYILVHRYKRRNDNRALCTIEIDLERNDVTLWSSTRTTIEHMETAMKAYEAWHQDQTKITTEPDGDEA